VLSEPELGEADTGLVEPAVHYLQDVNHASIRSLLDLDTDLETFERNSVRAEASAQPFRQSTRRRRILHDNSDLHSDPPTLT
jgi:hypothetical protein